MRPTTTATDHREIARAEYEYRNEFVSGGSRNEDGCEYVRGLSGLKEPRKRERTRPPRSGSAGWYSGIAC